MTVQTIPTARQIERFLECFSTMGKFEAMIQMTRGHGAFNSVDWPLKPDPDVMAVKTWLESFTHGESGDSK